MEDQQLQTSNNQLSTAEIKSQLASVQTLLKDVMQEDLHFGTIPGTKKPTIYKAGAELINFMFRLSPEYEKEKIELPNGHLMFEIDCILRHIPTGQIWGRGVGACSTMESKYRFRTGEVTFTGDPVPKDYWKNDRDQSYIGGKGFIAKKNPETNKWEIAVAGSKVENENPADEYNTVLKMAKKRAYNDATLTASAASSMFTQDLEEQTGPKLDPGKEVKMPEKKTAPPKKEEKKTAPEKSDQATRDQAERDDKIEHLKQLAEREKTTVLKMCGLMPSDLAKLDNEKFDRIYNEQAF